MTHLERILDGDTKRTLDTPILLSLVKEVGYYSSVLFCYLMEKQIEQYEVGDGYNLRDGRKWIPMLSEMEIWQDMPIFPDVRTIDRAAEVLEEAGYLRTERTGAFLDRGETGADGYFTGRARDQWPWWRICKTPKHYEQHRSRISALEAAAYGMAGAVILAHWRAAEAVVAMDSGEYKQLSGVELEEVLPMDEKTARRHIKALMGAGALRQHPKNPKLYCLSYNEITVVPVSVKTRRITAAPTLTLVPKETQVECTMGKPVLLAFHCESAAIESCDNRKLLFLDCHAA
jgi:hypothetical protein